MRAIKKLFKFNNVVVTDSTTGEQIDSIKVSGETTKAKVMQARIKEGKSIENIVIEITKVNETRVQTGEFFYDNSTLVVEPKTDDSEGSEQDKNDDEELLEADAEEEGDIADAEEAE